MLMLRNHFLAALSLLCLLSSTTSASAVVVVPATATVASPAFLRPGDTILGPVSDTQPLHVVVSLKLRNEATLDAFIETANTPNAVLENRALSSGQFLDDYAPTEQQANAVAAFLDDAGFQNIEIAPNRLLVSAYATAATAQAAFATTIVSVQTADNRVAYANNDAVHVPAELQDIVLSVVGLQTVTMKHTMLREAPPNAVLPQPQATVAGHNPKDWPIVYGASTLAVASTIPVGVVTEGDMTNTKNNLISFTNANALPTQTVQVVGSGGTDASGDPEWALDTQDIVGMTGGVQKLILYDSASLFDSDLDVAFNAAVSANVTKVISVSLGGCENGAPIATEDLIFKAAVAKGQTFVFSTGDDGADECGDGGITPSWPATSQYVVAVGGTTVATNGTTTWSSETVWVGTGGSPSKVEPIPTWQKNIGQNGSSTHRGVPDIAFAGDPSSGSIITLGSAHPQYGGTSLSAPLFAGAWARIMQTKGSALGFAAPLIYQIAAAHYATDFHDVVSGNNAGETAATGWDYCSGFGSMIVSQFASHIGTSGTTTPTKLAFTVEPSASYGSGATITVKVSVESSTGAVVATDTSAVTLALSGGTAGATFGGTKTVNAVAGVATFSNLTVNKVGTGYLLNATDGTLTAAASTSFNITAGTATSLTFTTQPAASSNVAAGATIQLTVHVQDANANPVGGQNIALALGTNPSGATLSVTASPISTDSSGNASFGGVSLNKLGTGYTLKVTDNSTPLNATTNAFNIVAGAAMSITFTTQPATNSTIGAGAVIPLVAHVQDAGANPIAGQNITLTIGANPGAALLSVTANPISTDASGNASFGNVSLNKPGTGFTLKVTDNSTPLNVTSNTFNILPGAPAQLLFVQQPGSIPAGVAMPAVTLKVVDAFGTTITANTNRVTLAVSGPGGFDPAATISVPFVNGVATFSNLVFDVVGTTYHLTATDTADTLTSAPSGQFAITAGAPRLIFTAEPADVVQGNALGTVTVREDDGSGNTVADNAMVDFSIAGCSGPTDLGSVAMNSGIATLSSDQVFFTLASGLTINVTSGTLSGTSKSFSVVKGELIFDGNFDGCRL
jgi:pseudomonalisin